MKGNIAGDFLEGQEQTRGVVLAGSVQAEA
jgi:hypothetical protein